ncbi:helix-turn-helix domain-containing protein [Peterkaempfera bronchialis]|uniref:XRE family transcriptional regulator n=1 Tax=Peterkaempfera bronchialis TaxID=2126346 RepID=A0A345SXM3_9ACTN|nr:helix-turn-helix transcriptional regulator [Peterkaempfera bronchialis]AXI78478.1 XRE family transcriptional regulator [Peterkaempfera bronchialis]
MTLGRLIKELRTAHSWSQSRLASELSKSAPGYAMTREYVSRWECDRVRPGSFWLRHLAAVLEVPLALLENELKRRTFFTDVAALAIAPIVASDLIEAGFAARLGRLGPAPDAWEEKLTSYGADYMSMGAADIQRSLAGELVVIQQQLEEPRLWAVAARLMTLYAKTFPGSDGSKALVWYRMAVEAADRSGDEESRVWVRGRAAIALGYEGASLPVANLLAKQAQEISKAPSLGLLNAVMGRAHVAAIGGDRGKALELAEEGRRIFDLVGSHQQTSDYAVPNWRMNVFRSLLFARLGDERKAQEAQESAFAELPDALPRFATHLEMHRGLMMARAGDGPGGIAYAQAALEKLPPEKHSLTLRMLMEEIKG